MTTGPDRRIPRYHDTIAGEARALWEDVRSFHHHVTPADVMAPARSSLWGNTVSPRVRDCAEVDLVGEAAWALLMRWQGLLAAYDLASHDEQAPEDALWGQLQHAVVAAMPPLASWLRYVDRFPAGEAMAAYRRHRRESILRWVPHLHIERSALAAFVRGGPALPERLRLAIQTHIAGPYNCFACCKVIAALRSSQAAPPASRTQRLAASAHESTQHRHETRVTFKGGEHVFRVSFFDDGNFLRVFPTYDGDRMLPRIVMALIVWFANGQIKEGEVAYPDHGRTGANLGPLHGLTLDDIASFSLERLPD
jgi:hypothetical protein